MNKEARIASLEDRISDLRSKVAAQQVSHNFQLVLHSYRPGQKTLTVAVLANTTALDHEAATKGMWVEDAGNRLIEMGRAVQKFRRTVMAGLIKSMQSKPELWGLLTEGGHTKFKAHEKVTESEPRYFPKPNRITQNTYLELVMTNPEDLDLETFKHMLQTAAKLYGTRVKV